MTGYPPAFGALVYVTPKPPMALCEGGYVEHDEVGITLSPILYPGQDRQVPGLTFIPWTSISAVNWRPK